MRLNKQYQRFHLTRNGWVNDLSFKYLFGGRSKRLLTRQYGEMLEVDFKYFKDLWSVEDQLVIEIYLSLYPHPTTNSEFVNYHKVSVFQES